MGAMSSLLYVQSCLRGHSNFSTLPGRPHCSHLMTMRCWSCRLLSRSFVEASTLLDYFCAPPSLGPTSWSWQTHSARRCWNGTRIGSSTHPGAAHGRSISCEGSICTCEQRGGG